MVPFLRPLLCGSALVAASATAFAMFAASALPAAAVEQAAAAPASFTFADAQAPSIAADVAATEAATAATVADRSVNPGSPPPVEAAASEPTAAKTKETATTAAPRKRGARAYRIAAPKAETAPAPLEGQLLPSIQYAVQDIFFLSPPQFPPILDDTTTIYEGQAILAVPILRRYAVSEAGEVDLSYKLTVLQPNGETEVLPEPMTIFKGKIADSETLIFPTGNIPAFKTGEDQPPGTYALQVEVHDQISNERITLEQPIEVIPYAVPPLPEDFDSNKWTERYYQNPQPELALPALYALMENIDSDRLDSITPPMLGFYNQLLTDNPWLLPHFSQKLEEALKRSRHGEPVNNADIILGLVLSFHLRTAQTRPEMISENIWLETESNRQFDWDYTDPYATQYIYYPHQLDYLWGQFMASGAYRPVYRLLQALLQDSDAAIEAAPPSVRELAPGQQTALREAVQQAAQWSLMSNTRQHRQVLAYLLGILLNERNDLSQENREQLRLMLAVATRPESSEQPQALPLLDEQAEKDNQPEVEQ